MILLRFLLNLDDKIYQLMPRYAKIMTKIQCHENTAEWRKVRKYKEFRDLIKILFVCHGNICRSPMAEFVFRDMVIKRNMEHLFFVASAATSTEEIGNCVHYGTRNKLQEVNISVEGKRAVQLKKEDYEKYDYLVGMDQRNLVNMIRILKSDPKKKISRLLDFTSVPRDIADPWYTGDFEQTYQDVCKGCTALLKEIMKEHNIKNEE